MSHFQTASKIFATFLGRNKMENKNWVYKLQFEEKYRASLCFGKMVRRVKDKGHEKEQTNIDK